MADDVARLSIKIDSSGVVRATDSLDDFSKASDKTQKSSNRLRGAIGGLGYQVQDIAVQLQGGQNALLVFGQQGSQIASLFGPTGAIVGGIIAVGAAIGTALIPSLFGANDELKEFEERMKSIDSRIANVRLNAVNDDIRTQEQNLRDLNKAYEDFDIDRLKELTGVEDGFFLPAPRADVLAEAQKQMRLGNARLKELAKDREDILRGEREKIGVGVLPSGQDELFQRAAAQERGEKLILEIEEKARQERQAAVRKEVLDRVNVINGENAARRAEADAEYEFLQSDLQRKKDATEKAEREQTEKQRKESATRRQIQFAEMATWDMAATVAGQFASLMEQTQGRQSGAFKAAFLVQKGIMIAQTIMQAEQAAVATQLAYAQLGALTANPALAAAGTAHAGVIRALGYASAGIIAAQTIADLKGRALGGQVNGPVVVGERGPELFVPGNQRGNIVPNEKMRSMGGGEMNVTIVNQTSAPIGNVVEQRISDNERVLIIQEAIGAFSAQLKNPNSRPSRAIATNTTATRAR